MSASALTARVIAAGLSLLVATGCFAPRLQVRHEDPTAAVVEVRLDDALLGTVAYGESSAFEVDPGLHTLELCLAGSGDRLWPTDDAERSITIEQDLEITIYPDGEAPAGAEVPHG
jgi:hypothetical protein